MRRNDELHGRKDPAALGSAEPSAVLGSLATERKIAASTQDQARRAAVPLPLASSPESPWLDDLVRARGPSDSRRALPRRAPCGALEQGRRHPLMATLLHGSGPRRLECCGLGVNDVDVARRQNVVRRIKGPRPA